MTAKMKIMMHNTKVRLPKAPTVLPIMEMSKLSVGQDLANLKTRSSLKDRRTERPETLDSPNSTRDSVTMMKSKMFQPSWK